MRLLGVTLYVSMLQYSLGSVPAAKRELIIDIYSVYQSLSYWQGNSGMAL